MSNFSLKIKNYQRTRSDKYICFRNKSSSYLNKRILNPLATEEEIKHISDDLLGEPFEKEHNCLARKRPWSIDYYPRWTDLGLVRRSISQILQDDFNVPAYFLDKVLLTIQKGIEKETYWKEGWHRVYQLMILQNRVSSKGLLNHIFYIAKTSDPTKTWSGSGSLDFTRVELLSLGINHKNLSPEDLTLLCHHPDSLVRDLASKNPLCPIEGKVVLALMGGSEN